MYLYQSYNWRIALSGLAAPVPRYLILAAWEGDFSADSSLICVSHLLAHFHLDSELVELTLKQGEWVE